MLHSKILNSSYGSSAKSSGGAVKSVVWIILFAFIGGCSYLAVKNYDRILYHFKKDKYVSLLETIEILEKSPMATDEEKKDFNKTIDDSIELLSSLCADNPGDSFLYFLRGKILWLQVTADMRLNPKDMRNILFLDYIDRTEFPKSINKDYWALGIVSLRKAMLMGLSAEVEKEAQKILSWLYFYGGKPYWQNAGRPDSMVLLRGSEIANLYKMAFTSPGPDWEMLTGKFDGETVELWKSIYYLKSGNVPAAFRTLRTLLLSETMPIRNSACYLLGKLMENKKNIRLKYYYHNMIDFDSFLQEHNWFLEEHHYTMRFLGKNKEAAAFLAQFEKTVNLLRSENS